MKKEKVVYRVGKFTNYEGKVQNFVICAISSMSSPDSYIGLDEVDSEYSGKELKQLNIGVSITNTKDTFDEDFGMKIAYSKAKSNKKAFIITNRSGFINEDVVNALLANYEKYIQKDPGCVIAGYDDAKKKYFEKQKYNSINLTEDEIIINKALSKATKKDIERAKKLVKYNDACNDKKAN
jgi:hypothetical protein